MEAHFNGGARRCERVPTADHYQPTLYIRSDDGKIIVDQSIEMGTPVIYVSMNYRVTGFGFLPGKEVKEEGVGNLGLHDQREALRWTQKYICAFGGDPGKVTIWGESAGAISVALHMVANEGNTGGLFRAGFMQSGSPIPVGDIASTKGQSYYDALVAETGCRGSTDTLDCLRTVPYKKLKAEIHKSRGPNWALDLTLVPRTDGVLFADNPQRLVQQGKVANIPFVTGDCDDEGTVFALSHLNITVESEFKDFIKTMFLPGVSDSEVNRIADLYPSDIAAGSPYDTGAFNALTPQYKRLASLIGDGIFQAPRRFFIQHQSGKQNTWSFLSKRLKYTPFLGSFHSSDNAYAPGEIQDYLIRFVVNLDPNGNESTFQWPKYVTDSPRSLTLLNGSTPLAITQDCFRKGAISYLTEVVLENPV